MNSWTSEADAARILEQFVSPFVGVVGREYERLNDVDDVRGFSYGCHSTDARRLLGSQANLYNGGGSRSRQAARLAGIGETVERYSAAYLPPAAAAAAAADDHMSIRASRREMLEADRLVWGPEELELFAEQQYEDASFPFHRLTHDVSIRWRRGREVASDQEIWVPAQLLHFVDAWPDEPRIGYVTSNGLACGIQFVEAQLSGLFEAIERDAFMLVWYNRLSLPHLDIESDPRLARLVERHIGPTGLDLHLIDLSGLSGVPTVLAVVRNLHSDVAPLALGAASAATAERAAEKAAFEGLHTRTWMNPSSAQATRSIAKTGTSTFGHLMITFACSRALTWFQRPIS
ncbi:YcaO-like family protein [Leifsonia sp. 71-9]|uniref:YcaO-like family protein n=1 Tax=Leifsonia sp. 71-9 TaxID=1895934 RepID=UPI0025BFD79C|nr:YcaO-like family protein [Leifsonia sp. 71-9]